MKNIIYKLGLVCFLATAIVSCDEDKVVLNPDNGSNLFSFNQSASNLAVNNEVQTDTIEVGVTSRSNVDRVIPINVDPASSATADLYTIEQTSLVIPAGEFVGKVVIRGNFDNLPDGQEFQLVLTLDDSVQILDDKNFHIVTIFKSCVTESLAGTHTYSQYNIVTGDGSGNGTPTDITTTGTVKWTNASTAGNYRTTDSSFGMYTAAYGDPAGQNPTNPLIINWSCSGISTNVGVDVYGDPVVYTVTSVNGPVLTLNWSSAYGDGGTVELTREDNEDWPDGLVTQ